MKLSEGRIELDESGEGGRLWLDVFNHEDDMSCVRLTPAQAFKLAARLMRWAWLQTDGHTP